MFYPLQKGFLDFRPTLDIDQVVLKEQHFQNREKNKQTATEIVN